MYTRFTIKDRKKLQKYLDLHESPNAIAARLGRSSQSVQMEIKRNTLPGKKYSAKVAHQLATERRSTSFTLDERKNIEKYLSLGEAPKTFAQKIGRSPQSVLSEIKRNTVPGEKYAAKVAQELANKQRRNVSAPLVTITRAIAKRISEILAVRITNPVEISTELRKSSFGLYQVPPSTIRKHLDSQPNLKKRSSHRMKSPPAKKQKIRRSPKYVDGDIVTY